MTVADFLQLPPAVRITFLVMLWPAIWAAALSARAFASDLIKH